MSGCTLANEIVYCILIIWISILAAIMAIILCILAADGSSAGSSSTSWEKTSPAKVCVSYTDCGSNFLTDQCYGTCEMEGSNDNDWQAWNAEMTATSDYDNEKGTNARLCSANATSYGGTCASTNVNASIPVTITVGSTVYNYKPHARYSDIYCSKKYCYKKSNGGRRLSALLDSHHQEADLPFYAKYLPSAMKEYLQTIKLGFGRVQTLASKRTHLDVLHGRDRKLLTSSEQDEIKVAAKAGCDTAHLLPVAFYGSIGMGICGIVFASMQACSCCQGSCGGMQQQTKMFAVYGAIAASWQVVPLALYLSMYLAVAKVIAVLNAYGDEIGQAFAPLTNTLLYCVILAASLIFSRGIGAGLSWVAAKMPHSSKAKAAGVEMVAQQAQVVTVVQPVAAQAYVSNELSAAEIKA